MAFESYSHLLWVSEELLRWGADEGVLAFIHLKVDLLWMQVAEYSFPFNC